MGAALVIDMDAGAAIGIAGMLVGTWWALAKLLIVQFEKRQDERFKSLTTTLTLQKDELDEHMKRQDASMVEIRRVEGVAMSEIRKVESELSRCQLDALQRFQTKQDSAGQQNEILAAIRALGARIDSLHGLQKGSQ